MHDDRADRADPPKRPKPPGEKRLEEIFGRDLGADRDDTGVDEGAREDWYRENRPPHHDEG
jgi:hypothetical protein